MFTIVTAVSKPWILIPAMFLLHVFTTEFSFANAIVVKLMTGHFKDFSWTSEDFRQTFCVLSCTIRIK